MDELYVAEYAVNYDITSSTPCQFINKRVLPLGIM